MYSEKNCVYLKYKLNFFPAIVQFTLFYQLLPNVDILFYDTLYNSIYCL